MKKFTQMNIETFECLANNDEKPVLKWRAPTIYERSKCYYIRDHYPFCGAMFIEAFKGTRRVELRWGGPDGSEYHATFNTVLAAKLGADEIMRKSTKELNP